MSSYYPHHSFISIISLIIGANMQTSYSPEQLQPQAQQPPIQPQSQNDPEQIDIEQQNSQFSQDFQSDNQNPPEINPTPDNEEMRQTPNIPKVTCPISAYSVFMREWRLTHVGEKLSMTAIGELWKDLDHNEKQIYEKKFKEQKQKYQEYEAMMLAIDPNFAKKSKNPTKSYFFPLHRVKAIMKQDKTCSTTTENVSAMSKAAEYFGQYLLEEIKKVSETKKRLDVTNLFEAINNNQNNLWFLNCIIDEYNLQDKKPQTQPAHHPMTTTNEPIPQPKPQKPQKKPQPQKPKPKKQLPKGQLKLTDMF